MNEAARRTASDLQSSCLRGSIAFAAIAVLAACTQGPPAPPAPPPASAVIGPAGGEVQASAEDGSIYRLAIPAGAVDGDVTVEITPRPTSGDELAAFRVTPSDLQLHVAATVEITLPDGVSVPPEASLHLADAEAPIFLSTTKAGTRLTADLRFFELPLDAHVGGVGSATAETERASAAAGTLGPAQAGTGGEVVASPADCASKLAAAQHSYQLFFDSESFQSAVRAATNGRSLAQSCGAYEAFHDFQELTKPAACARYDEIVLNAQVVAADAYEVFTEIVQPVVAWAAALEELAVSCPASATWRDVVHDKFSQFVDFYRSSLDQLPNEHETLLDEASKVIDLRGMASLLGMDDIAVDLEQDVSNPVLEMHRDEAYQECLEATDHYYLYSLFESVFGTRRVPIVPKIPSVIAPANAAAPYSDADLVDDVQHCASSFTLEVWSDPDVPVELTDKRVEFTPAEHAGEHETESETSGPVTGHLVLRGQVEQMRCGQGRALVDHELVALVEGEEVHRAASPNAMPEVDIEATLEARSFSTTHVNTLDIVLRRESDGCGGLYKEDYDLFNVAFTVDPAPIANTASSSQGAIGAETNVEVTYTVDWFDDGENLRQARIVYTLGDSTVSTMVDLLDSEYAAGFTGKEGKGTITTTHYVFCSEEGNGTLGAAITLFDEFGQVSETRSADVLVSYAACDGSRAAPPSADAIVIGAPR